MAWLPSYQELGRHPKLLRLVRQLGIPKAEAVGHLHYLWWWALDFAQDGRLDGLEATELAAAAEWDGDPEQFLAAMIAVRFIDQDGETLVIHDWDEYVGKLIRQRAANAQRMKVTRAAHVQNTLGARAPLEKSTVENITEQDITGEREETAVASQTALTPPEQEEDKSLWPEWYSLLWGLPRMKATYAQASEWKEANGISDELALTVVYGLRDWWPRQPAARQRGDAYATWQNWCRRDKAKNGASNGTTSPGLPTFQELAAIGAERRARERAAAGEQPDKLRSLP